MHTTDSGDRQWRSQELMEAYEAKLEDTQEELQKTRETKEQIALDHEEVRKVVEEDAQNEIEQQRDEYILYMRPLLNLAMSSNLQLRILLFSCQ